MGLFGNGQPRKPLDLTKFFWVSILALVFIQAFGLIFGKALGVPIYLGSVFLIVAALTAVYFGFGIALGKWRGFVSDRKDIIAFIVLTAFVVFIVIYFPKVAPDVFKPGAEQLMSLFSP